MTRGPVYRVYQDALGEWRWRLVAANGAIVADSAESYTRASDAERAAQTTAYLASVATVEMAT